MFKFIKWLGYSTAAILVLLAVLLWAGGAVNWNQEPSYELVQHWGEKGNGPAQFNDPTGIAVTADEVFIADARNSRIQVFDKRGHFRPKSGIPPKCIKVGCSHRHPWPVELVNI